jgi:hypothetical protein
MSRRFNVAIQKRKTPRAPDRPSDIFAFVGDMTDAVAQATAGGTKQFIRNLDEFFARLLTDSRIAALASRFFKMKNRLGSGPKMRVLKASESGTYLKARTGKFEEFNFPDETRRTGGVAEARALKFADGSVEFEMAGTVEETIAPLRENIKIPELNIDHKGIDYSRDLPLGSKKTYKGVSLTGYDRAHLWGPWAGDEARAGIMYAPAEFNRIWQNSGIEDRIRISAERVRAEGGTFVLRAKARSYPPDEAWRKGALRAKDQEFLLKEITYEIEVRRPDGTIRTARIDFVIPPPGSSEKIGVEIVGAADLLPAVSEFG